MPQRSGAVPQSPPAVTSASPKPALRADWLTRGLLAWMFLACCFPLYDTDIFWHLKTGEWIIQNKTIPGYDLFTYVDYDKRWIDLHWGFQVIVATLYHLGGANLLVVSKALALACALGIGCYAGGRSLPDRQRMLCWILPAITISGRGFERPEIITLMGLGAWLFVLTRLDSKPKWIWYLPFIQVVWINCHALYILGLIVGGCFVVDYIARDLLGGRWGLPPTISSVTPSMLVWGGGLCVAAALANPYFEEGALFPFVLLQKFTVDQAFYSVNVGEFQIPYRFFLKHGFHSVYLNAEIALWLAAATSFALLARWGRWSLFRVMLFAGFSWLAWKASRNTNIFSIVAGFVLSENLSDYLNLRARMQVPPTVTASSGVQFIRRVLAVGLLTLMVAVVTGVWNRCTENIRPFRLGEARAWFAHDAARFLGQPGFPNEVFAAHFGSASVYSYHNGPDRKVFMDGRLEVCSRQTFERFNEVMRLMAQGNPVWGELLRDNQGRLPAVMLDSRESRAQIQGVFNTPGWRLVYADQAAGVFLDDRTADALKLPAVSYDPLKYPPPL